MNILKKYGPYIVAAIIILFLGAKILNVTDAYSKSKGEYAAHVKAAEEQEARLQWTIAGQIKAIADRDADIATANERITALSASASVAAGNLEALESEYKAIIAAGGDALKQIDNLQAQVAGWKSQFSLAQSTIAEKDKIIFGLTEKYALQASISLAWKSQFEGEQSLRFDAERLIKSLEWKVRVTRAKSTIVTLAAITVAGYFIYDKFIGK